MRSRRSRRRCRRASRRFATSSRRPPAAGLTRRRWSTAPSISERAGQRPAVGAGHDRRDLGLSLPVLSPSRPADAAAPLRGVRQDRQGTSRLHPLSDRAAAPGCVQITRGGELRGRSGQVLGPPHQAVRRSGQDARAVAGLAQSVGLDITAFRACLDSGKYAQAVKDSVARIQKLNINGTPMFLVGKTPCGLAADDRRQDHRGRAAVRGVQDRDRRVSKGK